eukprot:3995625-Pyramimonas_sp.AAC.1
MGKKRGGAGLGYRIIGLHAIIALGTTLLIVSVIHQDTPFIVASKETFYEMMFDDETVQRDGAKGFLYEIEDCVKAVNQSIVTYYNLPSVGLDAYDVPTQPVSLRVVQFNENPRLAQLSTSKFANFKPTSTAAQSLETSTNFFNITNAKDDWLLVVDVSVKLYYTTLET